MDNKYVYVLVEILESDNDNYAKAFKVFDSEADARLEMVKRFEFMRDKIIKDNPNISNEECDRKYQSIYAHNNEKDTTVYFDIKIQEMEVQNE